MEGNRFGVYTDVANLFNTATVLSRQGRVPSGASVSIRRRPASRGARQVTLGARWMF